MGGSPILGIPIIGDIWDGVTGFFSDVAGWAIDSVIGAVTSWVMSGVLAMIEAIWSVIDNTTRVQANAEWFSVTADSPARLAFLIGVSVTGLTLILAIIRAVVLGSPGAAVRSVAIDLPLAVLGAVATVGVAKALLDVADGLSAWVWDSGRGNAQQALENMSKVLMSGLPGTGFLGVVLAVMLLGSLLFVWIVLFVRQSLIYIVLVLALAFAWPVAVFPPMRDTAKKTVELLVALIVAKPIMTLAMSVGISALGGIGATAPPTEIDCQGAGWAECFARDVEAANRNMQIEIGALMTGVVAFGLAAFMPFLIWKLMPIVAAAVVAQGIASAPMRSSQQAMQFAYYGQAAMARMTSAGAARSGGVASAAGGGGGAAAGPAVVVAAGQAAGSTASQAADGLTSSHAASRLTNSHDGRRRAVGSGDVSGDGEAKVRRYRYGEPRRAGLFGTLAWTMLVPLIAALGAAWLAVAGFVPPPLAVPVVAAGLWLALGRVRGRPAHAVLPAMAAFGWRRLRHRHRWCRPVPLLTDGEVPVALPPPLAGLALFETRRDVAGAGPLRAGWGGARPPRRTR